MRWRCSAMKRRLTDVTSLLASRVAGGQAHQSDLSAGDWQAVLDGIRRHQAKRAGHADPAFARQRAAAEIDACLGPLASAKILAGVSTDCRNLLAELQPVLSLFIGRQAAERLASRVVEARL